jgi:tetratricopeptide (TPR) repeat protein
MKLTDAAMSRLSGLLGADAVTLGRYRLVRPIASGAFGRVYEAEDIQLGRRVAMKILGSDAADAFVRRFHREASVAAKLRHPGIVIIHEVAMARREDGSPAHYIVMDLYGRTLEDALRNGALDRRERVALLEAVARAVHFAHDHGVVHRDLKPANILLDVGDRPVVTDFGLAREESQLTHLTASGAPVGTPHYMSPEQVAGRLAEIGVRSDVYALGVILYRLVSDRLPFPGAGAGEIYAKILSSEIPPPLDDRDLQTICAKAMARLPALRYASALDFAEELKRWRDGDPISARPETVTARAWRQARRHSLPIAATVAILAAAGAVVVTTRATAARLAQADAAAQIAGAFADLHVESLGTMQKLEDFFHASDPEADPAPLVDEIGRAAGRVSARHPAAKSPRAWFALARFFAHRPEALDELDAACRDAGPDPFPHLLVARARLARYARDAVVASVTDRDDQGSNFGVFQETASMKADRAAARAALDRAIALKALCPAEVLAFAEAAARLGDGEYERAAATFAGLPESAALRAEADTLRGVALARLRRCAEAAEAWERAGARGWFNVLALAAMARLEAGDADRAIADAQEALRRDPASALCWFVIARAHEQVERYEPAIAAFDAALRLEPGLDEAFQGRGHCLIQLAERDADPVRRLERALDDLGEAIRLDPASSDAHRSRAQAYLMLGDHRGARGDDPSEEYARALSDAERAVALAPRSERAVFERGNVLVAIASWEEGQKRDAIPTYARAVEDYTAALRLAPDYALAYANRGNASLLKGSALAAAGRDPTLAFQQAIADCTEAVQRDGALVESLNQRGIARRGLAEWRATQRMDPRPDLAAAVADHDEALRREAGNLRARAQRATAKWMLAHVKAQLGEASRGLFEEALEDAREARRRQPTGEAWAREGDILRALERWPEAVEALEEALKLRDEPGVRKALAEARAKAGEQR